jgi:hypothetical protein
VASRGRPVKAACKLVARIKKEAVFIGQPLF